MPEVLDQTEANLLIKNEDGEIENIPRSPMNELLYTKGLWDVFRTGTEILNLSGTEDEQQVRITPSEGAEEFDLKVGDAENIRIGPQLQQKLFEATFEVYDSDDRSVAPLIGLFDQIRCNRTRKRVVNKFAEIPPFKDRVEIVNDGWLIKDHLVLSYDNDLYHPQTESQKVSGSSVKEASSSLAYKGAFGTPRFDREVELDGSEYRLTDEEMRFIQYAMWAVSEVPDYADEATETTEQKGTPGLAGSSEEARC